MCQAEISKDGHFLGHCEGRKGNGKGRRAHQDLDKDSASAVLPLTISMQSRPEGLGGGGGGGGDDSVSVLVSSAVSIYCVHENKKKNQKRMYNPRSAFLFPSWLPLCSCGLAGAPALKTRVVKPRPQKRDRCEKEYPCFFRMLRYTILVW